MQSRCAPQTPNSIIELVFLFHPWVTLTVTLLYVAFLVSAAFGYGVQNMDVVRLGKTTRGIFHVLCTVLVDHTEIETRAECVLTKVAAPPKRLHRDVRHVSRHRV